MQKAAPQHAPSQQQPAAKQPGAAPTHSTPGGEKIAQLEAMANASPQAQKLSGLAAMMNASPAMAAQRKMADMIHNSPGQMKQQAVFDAIHNSPRQTAQRRQFDSLFGTAQRQGAETPQAEPARCHEAAPKPNNTGLPDNLKDGIESLSGISMDNVKVHYNSSQPAQLNAHAYAQGTDIHVAPGQEKHLPHEAWHVVQQAQGRVRPTMQMKESVPVNDDAGLEHEADVMGARAASVGKAAQKMPNPIAPPATSSAQKAAQLTELVADRLNVAGESHTESKGRVTKRSSILPL